MPLESPPQRSGTSVPETSAQCWKIEITACSPTLTLTTATYLRYIYVYLQNVGLPVQNSLFDTVHDLRCGQVVVVVAQTFREVVNYLQQINKLGTSRCSARSHVRSHTCCRMPTTHNPEILVK